MAKTESRYETFTTPVGLTGFASTRNVDKLSGRYQLALFLENTAENRSFINDLMASHNANIAHERDQGATGADQVLVFDIKESDPQQFLNQDFLVLRVKSKNPPDLYDASGQLVSLSHEIPIGSKVRLSITLKSYNMTGRIGSALYLQAVQIVSMPERTQNQSPFRATDGDFIGVGNAQTDLEL